MAGVIYNQDEEKKRVQMAILKCPFLSLGESNWEEVKEFL
jgi:hypothetical protein